MLRKLLFLALVSLIGCGPFASAGHAQEKRQPAPYVHIVMFSLKKDAPKNAAEGLIADAHTQLRKIPTVRDLRAGRPADMATPLFAKKDYHVGLVVFFDDYAGLKTYLDHELHTKYVDKHMKHVDTDRLLVFDFVNTAK